MISVVDLVNMVQSVVTFHDDIAHFINKYEYKALPNSKGDKEAHTDIVLDSSQTVSIESDVKNAFLQGTVLIEVAADQLMALSKTLTEPIQTIAPWTCLRAILESSAVASWMLDPTIDSKARASRGIAYRYEGLIQQRKYANAMGDIDNVDKLDARIDNVETKALSVGFAKVLDKNGKRIGIGQYMPELAALIKTALDDEDLYRVSSFVIHGNLSILRQLSLQKSSISPIQYNNVELHMFKKSLAPENVVLLCEKAVNSVGRPVWYKCQLFGWDEAELTSILEKAADAVYTTDNRRFWRNIGNK
jgi:hypothetical protein